MTAAVVCPVPAPFDWSIFDPIVRTHAELIIVLDSDTEFEVPPELGATVLNRTDQERLILPRADVPYPIRSAAVRNFGHLFAYKQGYDPILSLDYDCKPSGDWIDGHMEKLAPATGQLVAEGWLNPIGNRGWYARGFPYEARDASSLLKESANSNQIFGEVKLSLGTWSGVLDLYGIDKLKEPPPEVPEPVVGAYCARVPISGMNVAFRRELLPAYFFLPDVRVGSWPLSRHDDIWGGYVLARLMMVRGDLLRCDGPVVQHLKQTPIERVLVNEHHMHLLFPHWARLVESASIDLDAHLDYALLYQRCVERMEAAVEELPLPGHYRRALRALVASMAYWSELFAPNA